MNDIQILTINTIIWGVISLFLIKKYSTNNIGVIFVIFYTILSLFAIHLRMQSDGTLFSWVGINLPPLLFLQFFIVLYSSLLCKLHNNAIHISHPPTKIMNIIYVFIIFFSLLNIFEIINNFTKGIILLATNSSYGQEIYAETTEKMVHTKDTSNVVSIIGVVSNIAKNIAPLFLCYYFTEKKHNIFILIGLGLATFVSYMYAISMGMRSVIILNTLSFLAIFFFLKKFISNKVYQILKKVLLILGGIVILGFYFITASRTEHRGDDSSFEFIESYAAQSFLYFGKYGFDNGEQIRKGDRTMPFIKSIFSIEEVARSTYDRRLKYNRMKINESVFVTFVGDFVFDFGIIGGAAIMTLLYLIYGFFLKYQKKKILYIDQIVVAYLVIYTLCGFYLYPLSDYAGNIMLISLLLISLFFKLLRRNERIY